MALPAHRVIGHKEYGNTAPGGYPGRKTDPVYDMNWRRQRVAAFTPRTLEDDMPYSLDEIATAVVTKTFPRAGQAGGETSLRIETAWNADNWAAVFGLQAQVTALTAAVTQLAAAAEGVDPDDIKAHISAEVERAMQSFRERVAEGYDVRLEPKGGETTNTAP